MQDGGSPDAYVCLAQAACCLMYVLSLFGDLNLEHLNFCFVWKIGFENRATGNIAVFLQHLLGFGESSLTICVVDAGA